MNATAVAVTGQSGSVICKGDTGAPAIGETDGKAELAAVASRSWQGGCLGTPATETRTGATGTRVDDLGAWIQQVRASATAPTANAVHDPGHARLEPLGGHLRPEVRRLPQRPPWTSSPPPPAPSTTPPTSPACPAGRPLDTLTGTTMPTG
ncbi:hypothetical protein PUR71_11035 [Streptomyces sp. SP17BM10]|uniref:hypothetical protein n=1 Tax=Streptomyces sp. SP17BM10 TaxID=3002530 RepID=UPI002E75F256|nr:hypothetical protein [Streptomyces sp. SP17BM10]MEE1783445.1 hypothetical protein [Streptomyces sp. SP17BM10]